jgi:hypothetical protein
VAASLERGASVSASAPRQVASAALASVVPRLLNTFVAAHEERRVIAKITVELKRIATAAARKKHRSARWRQMQMGSAVVCSGRSRIGAMQLGLPHQNIKHIDGYGVRRHPLWA